MEVLLMILVEQKNTSEENYKNILIFNINAKVNWFDRSTYLTHQK